MTMRAVLFALCLPLACAQAAENACPPAIVGVSDLGYSSYQDGNVIRGISIDVMEELQKRSGCKLSVHWYPRSRLYAQFFSGKLDITGASLRTPERDRYGTLLPYTYSRFELVLLNKEAGNFHSLAEFVERSTARLNVTRGIFYNAAIQAQFDRLQQQGRLEYVNDFGVVFRKILAGRAEGTLAPLTIHMQNQRQFGMVGKMSATTVAESPRTLVGLYISNKVPPDVLQRYANALRSIVADGSVQRFYEHYLDTEAMQRLYLDGPREILDALPPPR